MARPRFKFRTVPDELVEDACVYAEHFAALGYRIDVEPTELGYPFTPTLRIRRQQTSVMVEVDSGLREGRIDAWIRYARSLSKDTRIALALQSDRTLTADQENRLRTEGVGLYTRTSQNVVERIVPRDIPVNVALPPLGTIPLKLRPLLGGVYEQFDRSHWRQGFEDACKVLENEAARYLKRDVKSGRIVVLDRNGKPKKLNNQLIDRMPMGELAKTFASIVSQTHADSTIADALERVNQDRIAVVHRPNRAATEARLRRNVGQHIWVIVGTLAILHGIKRK